MASFSIHFILSVYRFSYSDLSLSLTFSAGENSPNARSAVAVSGSYVSDTGSSGYSSGGSFGCEALTSCSQEAKSTKTDSKVIDDQRACKICYAEEMGVVFLPCGHLVACVNCAPSLKTCAVCRKPFSATVRAYLS